MLKYVPAALSNRIRKHKMGSDHLLSKFDRSIVMKLKLISYFLVFILGFHLETIGIS